MPESNYIEFGGPSHSGEYCVMLGAYDHNNYIPGSISGAIADKLGPTWDVSNRGTRLEIMSKKYFYGYRDDALVIAAVLEVIGEAKCLYPSDLGKVKFALPMLRLMEEVDGEVRFLNCAILRDTNDTWTVKPVDKPHFDPDGGDKNARFHHAWMRIPKTDQCAELIADTFDLSVLSDYEAREVSPLLSDMWRKSERTR